MWNQHHRFLFVFCLLGGWIYQYSSLVRFSWIWCRQFRECVSIKGLAQCPELGLNSSSLSLPFSPSTLVKFSLLCRDLINGADSIFFIQLDADRFSYSRSHKWPGPSSRVVYASSFPSFTCQERLLPILMLGKAGLALSLCSFIFLLLSIASEKGKTGGSDFPACIKTDDKFSSR